MSCQYKNIFGNPGQGIHSIRIPFPGTKNGIALVDTLLTLIAAYLIGRYYRMKTLNIVLLFLALVLLSVFVHKVMCVDTPLTKMVCSN